MRKGILHTLEAIIAMMILLGFILLVMPQSSLTDSGTDALEERLEDAMYVLDMAGDLRENAQNARIDIIEEDLLDIMPVGTNLLAGITYFNITRETLATEPSGDTMSFIAPEDIEQVSVEIYMESSIDPQIMLNGESVWSAQGNYSGSAMEIDITSDIATGENEINITSQNSGTVLCRVYITSMVISGNLPQSGQVVFASRLISGGTQGFEPMEVFAYAWN